MNEVQARQKRLMDGLFTTKDDMSFAQAIEVIVEAMGKAEPHWHHATALDKIMDQCLVRWCEEQEKFVDSTDDRTGWPVGWPDAE